MKYIKLYEASYNKNLKYKLGDYVIPQGENPKDSYSIISKVLYSHFADYMLSTFNIYTNEQIEHFPIMDHEIIRKMTQEEIDNIQILKSIKKYNI